MENKKISFAQITSILTICNLWDSLYSFANAIDVCWFIENGAYPDVLIVDQVMPDFTGIEVIDRVRAFLPRWCRVILISGHTELVDKLDLKNHGISAFLPKPIDLDKLSSLVAI